MNMLFFLASAFAFWPVFNEPAQIEYDGSKDAALIVAIEDYTYMKERSIKGATDNGQDWRDFFIKSLGIDSRNVKFLYNEKADKLSIEDAAQFVSKKASPGGKVWLVFIGHGAPSKDKKSLLLPVDTKNTAMHIEDRGIPKSELLDVLKGNGAHTVSIIDACFSGRDSSGEALMPNLQMAVPIDQVLAQPKITELTATTHNQYAGSLPKLDRPAFSYLTLGALRGWGDSDGNGEITADEVHKYTYEVMQDFIMDRKQEPTLRATDKKMVLSYGKEPEPNLKQLKDQLNQISEREHIPQERTVTFETAGPRSTQENDVDFLNVKFQFQNDFGEPIPDKHNVRFTIINDKGMYVGEDNNLHNEIKLHRASSPESLYLNPGEYTLEINNNKYAHIKKTIKVDKSNLTPLDEPTLKPITIFSYVGKIHITSNPKEATVVIDGEVKNGKTPFIWELKEGEYNIIVEGDRFHKSKNKTITVQRGKIEKTHFTLEPNYGYYSIDGIPKHAVLKLDGEHFEFPLDNHKLSGGKKDFVLEADGYQKQHITPTIPSDGTSLPPETIELKPITKTYVATLMFPKSHQNGERADDINCEGLLSHEYLEEVVKIKNNDGVLKYTGIAYTKPYQLNIECDNNWFFETELLLKKSHKQPIVLLQTSIEDIKIQLDSHTRIDRIGFWSGSSITVVGALLTSLGFSRISQANAITDSSQFSSFNDLRRTGTSFFYAGSAILGTGTIVLTATGIHKIYKTTPKKKEVKRINTQIKSD